jgi:F-type H+-transporting ATPase subunit g
MALNPLRRLPRSFKTHATKRPYSTTPPSQSTDLAQKKAAEYLAIAQTNLAKVWGITKKGLGPVGEKLGGALGGTLLLLRNSEYCIHEACLLAYRAPVTYNLHVTRELLKQVYVAERLQPPQWTTVVNTYNTLWSRVKNPAYLRELANSGEWMKVGVYAIEGYGIFKVCFNLFLLYTFSHYFTRL